MDSVGLRTKLGYKEEFCCIPLNCKKTFPLARATFIFMKKLLFSSFYGNVHGCGGNRRFYYV